MGHWGGACGLSMHGPARSFHGCGHCCGYPVQWPERGLCAGRQHVQPRCHPHPRCICTLQASTPLPGTPSRWNPAAPSRVAACGTSALSPRAVARPWRMLRQTFQQDVGVFATHLSSMHLRRQNAAATASVGCLPSRPREALRLHSLPPHVCQQAVFGRQLASVSGILVLWQQRGASR